MALEIGTKAPDFALRNTERKVVTLDDVKGRRTLLVFIPYAFSNVCGGEVCELRDNLAALAGLDANVVVITCNAIPANAAWAQHNGLSFPILSDFWPHGETSRAYDTFNEMLGSAHRTTYVLDEDGVISAVVASGDLGTARSYDAYVAALS